MSTTSQRVPYLTQAWLDMTTEAMSVLPPCRGATLVMQCVMTDAPAGGDIVFHRIFDDGRLVASTLGAHDSPDVVLHSDHEDSARHVRGEISADEAFATGKIIASGNVRLLGALRPMTESERYFSVLTEINERTDFG